MILKYYMCFVFNFRLCGQWMKPWLDFLLFKASLPLLNFLLIKYFSSRTLFLCSILNGFNLIEWRDAVNCSEPNWIMLSHFSNEAIHTGSCTFCLSQNSFYALLHYSHYFKQIQRPYANAGYVTIIIAEYIYIYI